MEATVRQSFDELMQLAEGRCRNEGETEQIRKAFDLACEAHRNVLLHSTNEPYILHPLEVAKIVVDKIGLGYKSVCAALLHDAVGSNALTLDDIKALFDEKIAQLVEGLQHINSILESSDPAESLSAESVQAENFKRILLSMGDDVRVVLIQLAIRLQDCRRIDTVPDARKERILSETMSIFIPLAHRLGLYSIKSEMENIWLRCKEPHAYAEIAGCIDKDSASRAKDLDEFIAPIAAAMERKGYRFEIKKRIKTPYSIWYKMKNKHVPFEQIYDLYAVRIIFTPELEDVSAEREQAYIIYSIVTELYRDKPSRLRDWIKQPKSNGYEALHCTLMSNAGIWIEVQIRSRRMDDVAEKGIAAHWTYKNDGYLSDAGSQVDRWLAKVQEILGSGSADALELLEIIQDEIATGDIVVFTPKGEQRVVPNGATALDFAYRVHTGIGNHAIAAKVNQKLSPLSRRLKAGDQVEIITARNAVPDADRMAFLHTRSAKRSLMEWLKSNAPDQAAKAETLAHRTFIPGDSGDNIPLRISLRGKFRPGLSEAIETALKKIEGIDDVIISEI